MQTLYLLRHGQKTSQNDRREPTLTPLGVQQAQQTAIYLQKSKLTQIFSSPVKRAQQTAHIIAEKLQLPVKIAPCLTERMLFDPKQYSKDEFFQDWHQATANRQYTPKYGDSSASVGQRIANFVARLQNDSSQNVLLVSHGGAIMDYLRTQFGDDGVSQCYHQYPSGKYDYQYFTCGLSKITFDQEKPILQQLNYVEHLDVKIE